MLAARQLAGIINIVIQANACFKTKGAFFYFAKIEKCHEKVWKKGVEFRLRRRLRRDKLRRGKKTDPAKWLFPLLKTQPLYRKLYKAIFYGYAMEKTFVGTAAWCGRECDCSAGAFAFSAGF